VPVSEEAAELETDSTQSGTDVILDFLVGDAKGCVAREAQDSITLSVTFHL